MPIAWFPLAAATRWLEIWTAAGLIGAPVLDLLVFPRPVAELSGARRCLRRWSTLCVLLLMLGTAAELVLRASVMSGSGLATGIAAVPTVLLRTHFGHVWVARSIALGVALLLSPVSAQPARAGALALAVGIALSTSLTGHAADWGDLSTSVLSDCVHLVAASAWTGGLLGLALVARCGARAWPPALVAAVARRFSTLAGWCLVAVIGTGIENAWVELGAISALWTTPYGRLLAAKLSLLVPLLALAAVNRYGILPHLDPSHSVSPAARIFRRVFPAAGQVERDAASARLWSQIAREALLAAPIFACTAILGELAPARHSLIHERDRGSMDAFRTPGVLVGEERLVGAAARARQPSPLAFALAGLLLPSCSRGAGVVQDVSREHGRVVIARETRAAR
jgi:copper resistance protein D